MIDPRIETLEERLDNMTKWVGQIWEKFLAEKEHRSRLERASLRHRDTLTICTTLLAIGYYALFILVMCSK